MWHKKYKHCVDCNTTQRKHMAKGMCNLCYLRRYRNDAKNKDQISECKRNWYKDHRDEQLKISKERRERIHFDGKRDKVLARDKYMCIRCGNSRQLTVHHKDHNGRGSVKPNNRLSNLETVCRSCHVEEHRSELIAARMAKNNTPKLLKNGRWSSKHDACCICGLQTAKHASKGVCARCYLRRLKHKMT